MLLNRFTENTKSSDNFLLNIGIRTVCAQKQMYDVHSCLHCIGCRIWNPSKFEFQHLQFFLLFLTFTRGVPWVHFWLPPIKWGYRLGIHNHIYTRPTRSYCTVKLWVLKKVKSWDIWDPSQTLVCRGVIRELACAHQSCEILNFVKLHLWGGDRANRRCIILH